MKTQVLLGDLSYFNEQNLHNLYAPLGVGFCASYVRHRFGPSAFDITMTKHPETLLNAVRQLRPRVVGLSLYYWNLALTRLVSRKVKEISPETQIICGGPCLDIDPVEQRLLFDHLPNIDAAIPNEGEAAFGNYLERLEGGEPVSGTPGIVVREGDGVRAGQFINLATDLSQVPSPYLAGIMDEFLVAPFHPMIQTNRLCPYTCLAGDTPVNTLFGDIPIRELAERYGDGGVPVYTFDPKTKLAFTSDSVRIRRYGQNQQLVRVRFDNETHIDCTPDHGFLVGSFNDDRQRECEAGDLRAGNRVMALRERASFPDRVVSVERLTEPGDVYCLTVPATGWFYANNVLVKNCAFCVSGKDRGKMRAFPVDQVKAEIDYIVERFQGPREHLLYIVDENFGIQERDVEIAEHLAKRKRDSNYPNRVYFYNDKRFRENSRRVHEAVAGMVWHGVCLSLQSENPETLKAIKRRNLTDPEITAAIAWAKGLGLKTSTELIFGLPMETKESFLHLVDKVARFGFETIQFYNLILFPGIEMNRAKYREDHKLKTMLREITGNHGRVEGELSAETEEIVVSCDSFSLEDYKLLRKIRIFVFQVYVGNLLRNFFESAVASGISLTELLIEFLTPTNGADEASIKHRQYLVQLDEAILSELYEPEEMAQNIDAANRRDWANVRKPKLYAELEISIVVEMMKRAFLTVHARTPELETVAA